MIDRLSQKIWSREAFQSDYAALIGAQLGHQLGSLEDAQSIADEAVARLLQTSVILASSSDKKHRSAAYRIVAAATELNEIGLNNSAYVLLLALARMGNFPALEFAKRKFEVEEFRLPVNEVGWLDSRREANSINISERKFSLTDFQLQLWSKINLGTTLGVSAPTSAGKSFVMEIYARSSFLSGSMHKLCYLVPTRALINQVSDDVSNWINTGVDQSELITMPIDSSVGLPERAIYVLTQERLQLMQMGHPELNFDLVIVDEAQSLADGPRGVLLYNVLEETLRRRESTQVLFAGPNIKNPASLTNLFVNEPNSVSTSEPSVVQNVVLLNTDETKPKSIRISARIDGQEILVGTSEASQPLLDHRTKLVNLALQFGSDGQTLIYADGPAECEKIAFGLADREVQGLSDERKELSEFIKEAVHPKFQLSRTVLNGVGLHFGRLPSLVRKAIEDAFSDGHLDFLVTTSTLLYGVNLPARNLFLHKPHKGKIDGKFVSLDSNEFWNLAGRAGRMGKEFSGNIFLIDYLQWETDPLSGEAEREVTPAIIQHVVNETSELIDYIGDENRVPPRNKQDEFENTFVKLTRDFLNNRLDACLERIGLEEGHADRQRLIDAIATAARDSIIDEATLSASPTVSIHRQKSLFEWIEKSLLKKGAEYVIPKHPKMSGAYQSHLAVIKRCHGAILKLPKADMSHKYFAQMGLKWMKGLPLPQIIDASFKHKKNAGKNPNIATVIRTTLSEVENDLRFKYVRLFSCYIAVLKQVLREHGRIDLIDTIPPIPLFLEVGASSSTMISFMGIGVSRYTSGKLSDLAREPGMSQEDAKAWIRRQDIDALDIPVASQQELRKFA